MAARLIIVPVVSAFTKKPDASLVEDTFAWYNIITQEKQKAAPGGE